MKFTPRERYKWPQKTAVFLTSVTLLTVFYTACGPIQKAFALQLNNLSQKMNYEENGMMLGFALNAEYLKVPEPSNYQESAINQVREVSKATYSADPEFKPNIIFVMSEAFWDPTLNITNVVISNGLIIIQGENFVENDKVYIDGKSMESTFASSNGLSASLPKDFSGKSPSLEIQVKLSDSMSKVISQSNVYQLPGS